MGFFGTPISWPELSPGLMEIVLCGVEGEADFSGILSSEEIDHIGRLRNRERRLEGVAARVALKRLLLQKGLIDSPSRCSIVPNRLGSPQIRLVGAGGQKTLPLSCSIAHKRGLVMVCLGLLPGLVCGVDIEEVCERPWRLRRSFAAADDHRLDEGDLPRSFALLWACKEAASKAFGLGMLMDFKELRIRRKGGSRFTVLQRENAVMEGRFFSFGRFAIAFCCRGPV